MGARRSSGGHAVGEAARKTMLVDPPVVVLSAHPRILQGVAPSDRFVLALPPRQTAKISRFPNAVRADPANASAPAAAQHRRLRRSVKAGRSWATKGRGV